MTFRLTGIKEVDDRRARWRAAYQKANPAKPPRTFFHEGMQRLVTHDHYATRIFWSKQMIDDLRRNYPTTRNEELAGLLGVSTRTMIRKARELGLEKDLQWLQGIYKSHLFMANASSRINGNAGRIKKGEHRSPATEFKARD